MWLLFCTVVCLGLYLLARKANVSLSVIGVGVDFLQVVSLFSSFGFRWPPQLRSVFKVASASTVNEQLVSACMETVSVMWGHCIMLIAPLLGM